MRFDRIETHTIPDDYLKFMFWPRNANNVRLERTPYCTHSYKTILFSGHALNAVRVELSNKYN